MFSEKLNVYEDENPDYIEMRDAVKAFVVSLSKITISVPLYRYFPTQTYRDYLSDMNRLQTIGRKIISKKYAELKAAIETGMVDENKANGQIQFNI